MWEQQTWKKNKEKYFNSLAVYATGLIKAIKYLLLIGPTVNSAYFLVMV